MRRALLLCLALAPAAHAQVVECPKYYPWQDTPIAEVPYQHKGQGFVAKSKLKGVSVYAGELHSNAELMGDRRKAPGGWDAQFGFSPGESKWLVCRYGDAITWWEQLDPKATNCTVEAREGGSDPMNIKATCK